MTTIWRFVSANEARSFLKDPGGVDWGNKGPQGAAEWVTFDLDVEKTRATIVRRQQNELLLARARDEVILKPLVEAQATFCCRYVASDDSGVSAQGRPEDGRTSRREGGQADLGQGCARSLQGAGQFFLEDSRSRLAREKTSREKS